MNTAHTIPPQSSRVKTKKAAAMVLAMPLLASVMSYACIRPVHAVTALEGAQVACILINDVVEDEGVLARVCGISDALIPEIRKIIFARKAAAQHKASAAASASVSAAASCDLPPKPPSK